MLSRARPGLAPGLAPGLLGGLTGALLVAFPGAALAADPDPWLGPDKALHFGVSAALATGGYALGCLAFGGDSVPPPLALGAGVALGAGLAKEALDAAGFGRPSAKDLVWDLLGTAAGLGLSVTVHVALGTPEREPSR